MLNEDRFFDADAAVRRIAREIYAETRGLPIVSPHGHVDPAILATDKAFPDAATLFVIPDHYVLRTLYSHGVSLDSLGVPPLGGAAYETDPRRIWRTFAEHVHLFRATPTGVWLDHELYELFGIRERLGGDTAPRIYDAVAEKLASPEFRPRALFERFNIEVLATTDAAGDSLEHHQAISESGLRGRVIPTFRPDALLRIASADWPNELRGLERAAGREITTCEAFVQALADRRAYFARMGATATDHGVLTPRTGSLEPDDAERVFQCARSGDATAEDQERFGAHLLMEMARLSTEDGLVMQLHAGSLRDHNRLVFERFGRDRGGDIPVATEFTRHLRPLLNEFGNDARFRLIVFTLDESSYSRELAPLAGHYPAMFLGAPWWFHDSIEGMRRFREQTTETAGIWKTAGFSDDTRAFCSIPARHDLSRRVDANWLAGLVARHVIDMSDARDMASALAYELARRAYRVDGYRTGGAHTR